MVGAEGSVRADGTPSQDVTVMEKVIVEATAINDHRGPLGLFGKRNTWLYVAVPDYEILSRCDTDQTVAVARHVADSLVLDKEFVPEAYLAPLATPMSFIMFDHQPSKAMEALIPNSIDTVDSPSFGMYHERFSMAAGGMDVCDSDTHCAVQNRSGMAWTFAGGGLGRGPIPTGLLFQISQTVPALPRWYQFGFVGPCGLLRMASGSDSMILASATWLSEAETKKVLAEAKRTRTLPELPSIGELFRRGGAAEHNSPADWPSPAWMAEAALFLRWGLYGEKIHRRAFEVFVERSRVEPVTESMFHECFGFGYAEMQSRLSRYLAEDGRDPELVGYETFARWRPNYDPAFPPFPDLTCREATRAEVARLLGDWERMEGDAKRVSDPALSRLYFKRAGKTLNQCYEDGERDPRFLAVLGLYDVDVGATSDARNILEAATDAGVARPAAYVALAQLNLNEAEAHPAAKAGRFSAHQTAAVLKPLFAARKRWRLDVTGYLLIAGAWSHCVDKPTLLNLAALREGMELCPFDSTLILSAAKEYAQWGYTSEAEALIDQRSRFADEATAKQLLDLRMSVKAPR
jgi:hypothetical protein